MSEPKGASFDAVPAEISQGGDLDIKSKTDGVVIVDQETGSSRRISASFAIDPAAERKLVWKFDTRILPLLAMMYLVCYIAKLLSSNMLTKFQVQLTRQEQLGKREDGRLREDAETALKPVQHHSISLFRSICPYCPLFGYPRQEIWP